MTERELASHSSRDQMWQSAGHGGQAFGLPPSWMLSAGIFLLGAAVAVLAVSAVPLVLVSFDF